MKICIPTSDDQGLQSTAFDHFGRAPFFTMVDIESGRLKVVANPSCHEHHGSCHHTELLEAHAVDAVVCRGIGRGAVAGLHAAGINVLVPADPTVSEIVKSVGAGEARPLSVEDACGGGRHRRRQRAGAGHGQCSGHHRH